MSSQPPTVTGVDGEVATDLSAHTRMFFMIHGHAVSQTVRAFADLDIADHLHAGGLTSDEIAARAKSSPALTARLLRAGTALGLVTRTKGGKYESTPLIATLARNAPRSLRPMAMSMTDPGAWSAWTGLSPTIRSGANRTGALLGADFFAYLRENPQQAAAFSSAMSSATTLWSDNIAGVIDTHGVQRAVDVGGASGSLLRLLQDANPRLQGVILDRAEVLEHARADTLQHGYPDRTEFVAGDFLTDAVKADLYLLKFILHDWEDEHCVQILSRCREEMLPDGRVAIIEFVWDDERPDPQIAISDMSMMAMLTGRERRVEEFDLLLAEAGLKRTSIRPTREPQMVITAQAI